MNTESIDPCGCNEQPAVSRRGFLGRAAALGVTAGLATLAADGLFSRAAFAADPSTYTGDVLVVLSLRGGFDGLNVVVPHGDPGYYAARPTIGVPVSSLIGGDAMFGLHPAMAPLLPFWQSGQLGAVHAVGQPQPNRSHFAAMEDLERAAAGTAIRTGWLDRLLGLTGGGSQWAGVAVGVNNGPRAFAGPAPDMSLTSLDGFTLTGNSPTLPMAETLRALYRNDSSRLSAAAAAVADGVSVTARLSSSPYIPANGAAYPDSALGRALRDVARLIKGDVGLMAAYVDYGDWDMHEGVGTAVPGQRMHTHVGALAAALAAFATDLGSAGLARVSLVTVSEFGRRVAENGSRGTDHGHGNAMLLLGGGVRGGQVYARWPGLAAHRLVAGDLAATTDYRSVIGEILQRRCGVGDLSPVFPGVAPAGYGLAAAR